MGRLGRLPVVLPEGVKAEISGGEFSVTGTKGTLKRTFPNLVKISLEDGEISVEMKGSSKAARAAQGSTRSHIANMVHGAHEGWKKSLEISGPGYRAEARGAELVLMVGYSHPVVIKAPEGITFRVEKNTIHVEGIDKEMVGHVSAQIRDSRRPNPYTGSGIKYSDEVVRRKVGKQAGKAE